MNKKKIKVFYDGSCNICKKEISFYSKIDKNNSFKWINIHDKNGEINRTGLTKNELMSALHIQKKNGSIIKGVEAFKVLWSELKYFKILSFFLKFKLVEFFANKIYKVWLRTR